jgi:hypothetical protein
MVKQDVHISGPGRRYTHGPILFQVLGSGADHRKILPSRKGLISLRPRLKLDQAHSVGGL